MDFGAESLRKTSRERILVRNPERKQATAWFWYGILPESRPLTDFVKEILRKPSPGDFGKESLRGASCECILVKGPYGTHATEEFWCGILAERTP